MTATITHIFTRQPYTPDNDTGSKYFRVTSASKPNVCARRKREIVMNKGFSEFTSLGMVLYSHPDVCDNEGLFLHDAYLAVLLMENGERYFK